MPKIRFKASDYEDDEDPDVARVQSILDQHKDKNFVQRIIDPTTVDSYVFPEDSDRAGQTGTHLMSYSTDDKGAILYPEIVYDEESKSLKRLGRKEAVDHALKTGEHIRFDKEEDAKWFGENYKKVWKGKPWGKEKKVNK